MLKAICIFCLLVVRINPWCDINNEFISSDNLFYLNLSEWGQTEQDCGVSGLFTLMWTCWVCGADSPRWQVPIITRYTRTRSSPRHPAPVDTLSLVVNQMLQIVTVQRSTFSNFMVDRENISVTWLMLIVLSNDNGQHSMYSQSILCK